MGYWLQLGVAGFRVDALPFVLEKPSLDGGRPSIDFDLLHQIRDMVQWRRGDAVLLAEANVPPGPERSVLRRRRRRPHDVQLLGQPAPVRVTRNGRCATAGAGPTRDALAAGGRAVGALPAQSRRARHRTSRRRRARGGVRRVRPASRRCSSTTAASAAGWRRCSATAGGSSWPTACCSRYPARRYCATATRSAWARTCACESGWRSARRCSGRHGHQAGFSSAERTVQPVIQRGLYSAANVNVEQQWRDPSSLLRWTSRLIRARKACPEIGWGTWEILPTRPANVLAIEYSWRGTSLVCVHNLAGHPVEVTLRPGTRRARSARQRDDRRGQRGRPRRHPPHRPRRLRLPLVSSRRAASTRSGEKQRPSGDRRRPLAAGLPTEPRHGAMTSSNRCSQFQPAGREVGRREAVVARWCAPRRAAEVHRS